MTLCGELYGGSSITIVADGPITCQRQQGHRGDHSYQSRGFGMIWGKNGLTTWTDEAS